VFFIVLRRIFTGAWFARRCFPVHETLATLPGCSQSSSLILPSCLCASSANLHVYYTSLFGIHFNDVQALV